MFGRTALTIARVRGVAIRLDISLLIILPLVALAGARQFGIVARALQINPAVVQLPPLAWGAILAVALFGSVLLHELAHVMVALYYGARVHSVTLMMLGGVTSIDKEARPEREAWMAAVGPLASFAIALCAYSAHRVVPLPGGWPAALLVLALMNTALGVFNLLPAFPMDGGRILRGLLARPLGHRRATRFATSVGKVLAVVMGIIGLLTLNFLLALVAVFIFKGASAERARFDLRDTLAGLHVSDLISQRIGEASADEAAGDAARRLLAADLVGAWVSAGPHPDRQGIVTTQDLAILAADSPGAVVADAVRSELPRIEPQQEAGDALEALARARAWQRSALLVESEGRVVGVVTPDDIDRALLLSSLGAHEPARGLPHAGPDPER